MERIRTADVLAEAPSFRDLLLPAPVVKSLEAAGYLRPSPVQHAAIPLTRLGLDVIIQAKAGTGKTLVFAITITEIVDRSATFPQALVLAPTREVALQAADVITEAAVGTPSPSLSVATLIGGLPTAEDERILRRKCHVVVGTPGRVLSLIERGSLVTQGISMLVLDEADKLLSSDFSEVVHQVIAAIPVTRQILALSATYTPTVAEQLKGLMHQPHEVMLCAETTSLLGIAHYYKAITASDGGADGGTSSALSSDATPRISQGNASIRRIDTYALKRKVLLELLYSISFHQAVVFCNGKLTADTLAEDLIAAGHAAACLSSDKDQLQRIDVLNSLRSFGLRIVVATDVAARGIDLDRVNLVVNFDLPAAPATLMHRVGRAGRFGTRGTAISLVYGNTERDDLKRAVMSAAGGDIFLLPDELPIGWSAAQLLDVAAVNSRGNEEHQGVQEHVKVISNGMPSSSKVLPLYGQSSVENQSNGQGDDKKSMDTAIEDSSSKIISSVSLWPEEQGIPFLQPQGAWPLQLAQLSPAMQGNSIFLESAETAAPSLPTPTAIPQREAVAPSSPLLSSTTHYTDVVKSLELDLQRTPESEIESVEVLQQAFNFSGSTVSKRTRAHPAEDTNTSEALEPELVRLHTGEHHHQLEVQVQDRQRRPLGSAQVSAYTRQLAQEECDHTRALAEEAALLESMAVGETSYFYDNDLYFEEDDEFDENGYYKNPRGQRQINYQQQNHRHIAETETETERIESVAMDSLENEAAWRRYWYDHYNQFGYWPGGNPTTSIVQPQSTLQIPSSSQLPLPATPPAPYSVITPGRATTAAATTAEATAPSPSLLMEVGGWSPTQGTPPNTAAVVASCADQGGYVRVPAQILQRYLELEWQQWQNRFFGGGGGGGTTSDV
ncbi:hypothetical protein Ndes2526B_g06027 [Nannochloris sp. 'desiccata']|nr:putative ATP-dependent RNA helicase DDX20 [Chlorella desiccata (nom. nud.)]